MARTTEYPPDYQHDWTIDQRNFIEWLALPVKERPDDAQTQKDFALKHGVHFNTLTIWKKIPGFADMVFDVSMAYLGGDVGDILRALSRKAKKEDIPAIKMVLEMLGLYQPGAVTEVGLVLVFGADEMMDVSLKVAEYERKRRADARRAIEAGGGKEGA